MWVVILGDMAATRPGLGLLLMFGVVGHPAMATVIDHIEIHGLDQKGDAPLSDNIQSSLSLFQSLGHDEPPARLEYLFNQADQQTRQALEPFGYYTPTIRLQIKRLNRATTILIDVDKGSPVRVGRATIALVGAAATDQYLQQDLQQFRPKPGQVFSHPRYEASKLRISRRLNERGYFAAQFRQRKVTITRASHRADIDLIWDSQLRYNMGPVTFDYDYFCPGLFDPLVYWRQGDYYHEGRLDRLRQSLTKLDYFSSIEIEPRPDLADAKRQVPIRVTVKQAKRTIYNAGMSYGNESGPGLRTGIERRYLNRRGHKINTQLDYALKHKSLSSTYRIPAFGWLDGWYAFTVSAYDENTKYINLRNARLSAARSGQFSRDWSATASINLLRERWRYGEKEGFTGVNYQLATVVYPQLEASYVHVDDPIFPVDGIASTMRLRGGLAAIGANTNFVQMYGQVRLFFRLGPNGRVILRGEAGTTWVGDLVEMPPSLRYFAGGANSIRGYAFREVGPRTAQGYAIGAKRLMTSSAEYEYYWHGGPIGAAIFVDTGSAFDQRPHWQHGAGFGFRYRSPVGPIRVDIGHGMNHPDARFQFYIDIGANL